MGSKEINSLIQFLFVISLGGVMFCYTEAQQNQGPNSLDSFILDCALKRTGRIHSGNLYDIHLPWNYSGLSASFVRIRSSRLWLSGANYSFFYIPPRTLPWPFSRRIRIIYDNLGNLSTSYYNVPNYTFITPVVGFLAYDATTNTSEIVEIRPMDDPILIHFPNLSLPEGEVNETDIQCVHFKTNGEVEFSNVTAAYSCTSDSHGHFSIVIPSLSIPLLPSKKSKQRLRKWWVIGFGGGFGTLVLLIWVGFLVCKCVRIKRIRRMQKESERSEALESVWVGRSRMPQASNIRTQPTIENNYVP